MAGANLTADRLKEFLFYDPESGFFTRIKANGTAKLGDRAGWVEPHGYIKISIGGKKYYAHRCAILYMSGEWPELGVDHIDGNRENNAYKNLRCADQSLNSQNYKRARSDNKSGFLGVSYHSAAKKFMAECKGDDGVRRYLGLFNTPEDAHQAYLKCKRATQSGGTI